MSLRPVWIVAFSGHRPHANLGTSPDDLRSCSERIRLVLSQFRDRAKIFGGSVELFLSAAEGADNIAIEAAELLGLAVHIILPLPISEFAEDFRGRPAAWNLALASIAKAGGLIDREEHIVSALCKFGERTLRTEEWPPAPMPGWTFRESDGNHQRNACYHDCGTQMLDAADALIAVWNQRQDRGLGGTLDVIEQAKARGIPIAIINSTDEQPAQIQWNAKPWSMDPLMTELDSASSRSNQTLDSTEQIENVFASLDSIANRTGGRLKNRATTIIALQFSATILATVNSALFLPSLHSDNQVLTFQWDATLIGYQLFYASELALLVTAFFLGLTSRWTDLKSLWRQTRFGAEVLRGLIHTRGLVDPVRGARFLGRGVWSSPFAASLTCSARMGHLSSCL